MPLENLPVIAGSTEQKAQFFNELRKYSDVVIDTIPGNKQYDGGDFVVDYTQNLIANGEIMQFAKGRSRLDRGRDSVLRQEELESLVSEYSPFFEVDDIEATKSQKFKILKSGKHKKESGEYINTSDAKNVFEFFGQTNSEGFLEYSSIDGNKENGYVPRISVDSIAEELTDKKVPDFFSRAAVNAFLGLTKRQKTARTFSKIKHDRAERKKELPKYMKGIGIPSEVYEEDFQNRRQAELLNYTNKAYESMSGEEREYFSPEELLEGTPMY